MQVPDVISVKPQTSLYTLLSSAALPKRLISLVSFVNKVWRLLVSTNQDAYFVCIINSASSTFIVMILIMVIQWYMQTECSFKTQHRCEFRECNLLGNIVIFFNKFVKIFAH